MIGKSISQLARAVHGTPTRCWVLAALCTALYGRQNDERGWNVRPRRRNLDVQGIVRRPDYAVQERQGRRDRFPVIRRLADPRRYAWSGALWYHRRIADHEP